MIYAGGIALAVLLFAVGWWGRAEAPGLAPGHLPEKDRLRRERTLRRGALACQLTAAGAVVTTVGSLLLR